MFRFILFLILLSIFSHAFSEPKVMVTIKPIHALVIDIMQSVDTPQLLLSSHETPHHYSLKPSQARQLHHVQLVIWIGPQVEGFMQKILLTLEENIEIIQLSNIEGLTLLPVRRGKDWENQHTHDFHKHVDEHVVNDPHIWLDPHNAKVIAQHISQKLQQIDKQHASIYQQNTARLLQQLDKLDSQLQQQLASVKNLPFLVFHDAYHYFEHRYGLNVVGVINLSPETMPSPKHLSQLHSLIKQKQVVCVFSEPQFQSTLVNTITKGTQAKQAVLDPLGTELGEDGSYFALLSQLGSSIKGCLAEVD